MLKRAFNARFWTGTAYRSPEHTGATDDRGNALAVVAGLVPESRQPAVREVLVTERHASPYFEKYVAEALIEMGHTDDALARLRDRYAEMIESPITTLWEGWELNSATYGGGTYNHAWSGGPLTLLSSRVVGVEPLTPGWATFRVAPRMGSLEHARAVVPAPQGEVVAEARQSGGQFALDVVVPPGTRATLDVPRNGGRQVTLNGSVVWDGSRTLHEGQATPPAGVEVRFVWWADPIQITVGPGRWRVVAR